MKIVRYVAAFFIIAGIITEGMARAKWNGIVRYKVIG